MPLDQLKNVGHILSDPTRIDTLRLVVSSEEPISAVEVAAAFGLHPNAARHHLAKLEGLGLVRSVVRKNPAGGRPAKLYTAGMQRVDLQYPPRQFLMLSRIILDSLEVSNADFTAAILAAGRSYGRGLAASNNAAVPVSSTPSPYDLAVLVAESCNSIGCYMKVTESDQSCATVLSRNCIFHEMATAHPGPVCAMCEGLMAGMAETAGFELFLSYNKRLALGDSMCKATMRFQPRSPMSTNN